jgi:hypothetical protein
MPPSGVAAVRERSEARARRPCFEHGLLHRTYWLAAVHVPFLAELGSAFWDVTRLSSRQAKAERTFYTEPIQRMAAKTASGRPPGAMKRWNSKMFTMIATKVVNANGHVTIHQK